ncbi:MAG: GntR family transcriptional regulator [Deltaproteobacteria bacterium]|nr:GntR family transcriptional regulator [Deltaproteobacteria bacterium]
MKTNHKETRSRQPLALQAYEIIHDKIITMALKPGEHVDEKALVEELGIGRTPVREALLKLASEHLVESRPNKGFIVKPLTLQDVKAMFEALNIIETGACALAVNQDVSECLALMAEAQEGVKHAVKTNNVMGLVKANHAFHMHFARCSFNEYIINALNEVRNEVNRLAYLSFAGVFDLSYDLQDHYKTVIREHDRIMSYLEQRDLQALQETVKTHIRTFQKRIINYLTT